MYNEPPSENTGGAEWTITHEGELNTFMAELRRRRQRIATTIVCMHDNDDDYGGLFTLSFMREIYDTSIADEEKRKSAMILKKETAFYRPKRTTHAVGNQATVRELEKKEVKGEPIGLAKGETLLGPLVLLMPTFRTVFEDVLNKCYFIRLLYGRPAFLIPRIDPASLGVDAEGKQKEKKQLVPLLVDFHYGHSVQEANSWVAPSTDLAGRHALNDFWNWQNSALATEMMHFHERSVPGNLKLGFLEPAYYGHHDVKGDNFTWSANYFGSVAEFLSLRDVLFLPGEDGYALFSPVYKLDPNEITRHIFHYCQELREEPLEYKQAGFSIDPQPKPVRLLGRVLQEEYQAPEAKKVVISRRCFPSVLKARVQSNEQEGSIEDLILAYFGVYLSHLKMKGVTDFARYGQPADVYSYGIMLATWQRPHLGKCTSQGGACDERINIPLLPAHYKKHDAIIHAATHRDPAKRPTMRELKFKFEEELERNRHRPLLLNAIVGILQKRLPDDVAKNVGAPLRDVYEIMMKKPLKESLEARLKAMLCEPQSLLLQPERAEEKLTTLDALLDLFVKKHARDIFLKTCSKKDRSQSALARLQSVLEWDFNAIRNAWINQPLWRVQLILVLEAIATMKERATEGSVQEAVDIPLLELLFALYEGREDVATQLDTFFNIKSKNARFVPVDDSLYEIALKPLLKEVIQLALTHFREKSKLTLMLRWYQKIAERGNVILACLNYFNLDDKMIKSLKQSSSEFKKADAAFFRICRLYDQDDMIKNGSTKRLTIDPGLAEKISRNISPTSPSFANLRLRIGSANSPSGLNANSSNSPSSAVRSHAGPAYVGSNSGLCVKDVSLPPPLKSDGGMNVARNRSSSLALFPPPTLKAELKVKQIDSPTNTQHSSTHSRTASDAAPSFFSMAWWRGTSSESGQKKARQPLHRMNSATNLMEAPPGERMAKSSSDGFSSSRAPRRSRSSTTLP